MRRVMHKPLPLTAEEWAEIDALPAEAIALVRKTEHGFHAVVAYAKRPGVLNSATRGYLSDPDFFAKRLRGDTRGGCAAS